MLVFRVGSMEGKATYISQEGRYYPVLVPVVPKQRRMVPSTGLGLQNWVADGYCIAHILRERSTKPATYP